jgi:hypothetical protein
LKGNDSIAPVSSNGDGRQIGFGVERLARILHQLVDRLMAVAAVIVAVPTSNT